MIRNDYIMRMISVFMERLVEIVNLRLNRKPGEALEAINRTTERIVGIGMHILNVNPVESLLDFMKVNDVISPDKCIITGELMKQQGEILKEQGNASGAQDLFERALFLHLEGFLRHEEPGADLETRIGFLMEKTSEFMLPSAVQLRVIDYYENLGLFSKAEDGLFQLAEVDRAAALEAGLSFYDRLMDMSDEELEAGNLPRAELAEGRAALETRH